MHADQIWLARSPTVDHRRQKHNPNFLASGTAIIAPAVMPPSAVDILKRQQLVHDKHIEALILGLTEYETSIGVFP
jgi:hypothetical protein